MTRVAFVIQRFGPEIVGGAEMYCRELAIELSQRLSWEIDVYTTCSRDYQIWDNSRPEGVEFDGNLKVFRFKCSKKYRLVFAIFKRFVGLIPRAHKKGGLLYTVRKRLENLWISLQGPYCPSLNSTLESNSDLYQGIFAFTYLFYPTIQTVRLLSNKTILVPFAHEEAPFYFVTTLEMLEQVSQIVPCSRGEAELISLVCPSTRTKLNQPAGVGLRIRGAKIARTRSQEKNLLYLGRIGRGKAIDELLESFQLLRAKHPEFRLVLAGVLDKGFALPRLQGVEYLGVVDEEDKERLFAEAFVIVNPSRHESLSLLVLEALARGKPVLANQACLVFRDLAKHVSTIFLYEGKAGFLSAVKHLKGDSENVTGFDARLKEAQIFVADNYSWNKTCQIYESALKKLSR
jgi:glycosyltransferase involved in cell wall biosynthesis